MFAPLKTENWSNPMVEHLLRNILLLGCLIPSLPLAVSAQDHWPKSVENAVANALGNREQWVAAWKRVPESQRQGLQFLLENMPEDDLQTLTADFLLGNIALAYQAKEKVAWGKDIPDDIFLNDVLPYANINERRDNWRDEFKQRFFPLIEHVNSPGTAAAKLNQAIFKELNVKYSTKRRRADQGPRESMASGLASCTGLSILLIDACRACGIPARFVGTPLWTDNSGNHSWVEVWDNGWHFTGAAEPNGDEIDRAWFIDRASKAIADQPEHSIYAVSFRRTPLAFPMVWDRRNNNVSAVNVTERYAKIDRSVPEGFVQLRIKTLGASGVDRCQANVTVRDTQGNVVFEGQSKDERFDTNDHLWLALPQGKRFRIEVKTADAVVAREIDTNVDGKMVTLQVAPVDAIAQLKAFLKIARSERPSLAEQSFASEPLSKANAVEARQLLLADHRNTIRETRQPEMAAKLIQIGDHQLAFDMRTFGEKPIDGHSLVISMHGGGGAPKRVNDRQWENQKSLYELQEGIYLAPRAPTDSWNMWHQDHIDALYTRLIENLIAIEGVNPDRVFITGYSAGGDGVFQLAPRMADQLAAAAMMAGHPNETKPLGLRNLPITLHVGGKDSAYNRNSIVAKWIDELGELRKLDPLGYEHWGMVYPEKGHWMDREDRAGVTWMMKYSRNIVPEKVVWLQDDVRHSRFYWLGFEPAAEDSSGRELVVVSRSGNTITVEQAPHGKLRLLLRDDMLDLDQEVTVQKSGQEIWRGSAMRRIRTIASTLEDRGDPAATFSAEILIEVTD